MSKTPILDQMARRHGIALSKEGEAVDDLLRRLAQGHSLDPVQMLGVQLRGDQRRQLARAMLHALERQDALMRKLK